MHDCPGSHVGPGQSALACSARGIGRTRWANDYSQRRSGNGKPAVKALLRYLEETVPLPALRIMFDDEEDRDYVPFQSVAPSEVVSVAEHVLAALIHSGMTPVAAGKRLLVTYPFNEYEDLPVRLGLAPTNPKGRRDG